ncbi:MAG: homocysteine S-methyltransferase family protein, partial [Oscillospiraceae bacterium]
MMSRFLELLSSGRILLTDGATGTLLQEAGMPAGMNSSLMALTRPELLERIHTDYFAAGSDMVFSNTFSASALKLEGTGHTVSEVVEAAVGCAKRAAAPFGGLVGLDVGPLGELLEPLGALSFERAVALFAEQMRAGARAGADFIAVETMMDLYEAKAAVLAAKEACTLPVMVTMTFEANGRTFTGCDAASMALTLGGLGADVLGVNCSVGPVQLAPIVAELAKWTGLPIAAKPNAGLPKAGGGYDLTPEQFAAEMRALVEGGASVVGGCCGTGPEEIRLLREAVRGARPGPRPPRAGTAICSAVGQTTLDRPRVVGERLNPSGKKRLRQALQDGDMSYVLRQAVEQADDGAEILDVNVGVPGIDEPATMARVVRAVQSVCSLPLQIDSADPDAIEAGLRAHNGRAIVNSVNGRDEVLDRLLPV